MKNKVTILIIAAIATLIALSAIQAYLIESAYQLKKKSFLQETDDAISNIDDHPQLDSIVDVVAQDLRYNLGDYLNDRISKKEVIQKLESKCDSLNAAYMRIYNTELKKIDLGYDIRYQKAITSIVITKEKQTDTIFPVADTKVLTAFGENLAAKKAHNVKQERTFTELEFVQQTADSIFTNTFDLELKSADNIVITDWKSIVFRRMATLMIVSVLLFLFVVGLLYYSIKNLINQRKITDVKTDFINNITHELKTPLATLSVATKSLRNKNIQQSPEAFENTLQIVERQNTRLQKLIDQVLTNSLSANEIVLSKDSVVDNIYFAHLLSDFKLSAQQHNLKLINNIYAPEVLLRIDTFHFTTALLNILENAVKYGKEEVIITLETALKNGEYIIKISDNGQGISEKDQEQIFDKFYRVSHGNVHNVKGLGLGLFYTSQIVNAHNGRINVQSTIGKGTTFIITIPIQ